MLGCRPPSFLSFWGGLLSSLKTAIFPLNMWLNPPSSTTENLEILHYIICMWEAWHLFILYSELKNLRFIHNQMLPWTLTFSLKKHSVRWYVQNGTKKVQFLNHFFTTFCVSNKECKRVSFSIYCLLGKNIEDIFDN